jgi:ankyrin repeat protein
MDTRAELFAAIKVGNLSAVQVLIDRDASLASVRDDSGESAVMSAVYHRQQPIARLLIERGARLDVFEASAVGAAGRLEAALAADRDAVRRLSPDGWTPLHLAAFFGHVRATEVLLAHGADTATVSKNATGNTPLHAALAGGHAMVAGVLIGAGADVNALSAGGWRPLHIAVSNGHLDSVKALVAQGADVNAVNDAGQTPLAVATHRNQKAVVEYLLRQGALS